MRTIATAGALVILVSILIMGCVECTIDAGVTRVGGSGRVILAERSISGVTGVHLATFGDLEIVLGKKEKLVIEAEDNLVEYFETGIDNGILEIKTRRFVSLKPKKKVKYHLTLKSLDTVMISSSGDIDAPHVHCREFDIKSSSSGDLTMEGIDAVNVSVKMSSSGDVDIGRLEARELEVGISSSGDLTICDGEVGFQSIRLSSAGDYNAGKVTSQNAQASLSSSGDAYIHVDGKLNASLSSSGSLYFSGDASVQASTSSSGRLRRVD
jgi:hypothetical protein